MTEINSTDANLQSTEERSGKQSPRLQVDNISKSFNNVIALEDVSMEFDSGEIVGLVGENGAGKSTLLNILTGVLPPNSGEIYINGSSVKPSNPKQARELGISLVHQEQDVIPNLKGYENLQLGRENDHGQFGFINREKMLSESQKELNQLGIELDLDQPVSNYSFNDRQKLEIAKALTASDSENPVILLDEPTAGLEEDGRELLFGLMNDLRDRATFVFVSHELDEILEMCDRIYVLKDGKVVNSCRAENISYDELQRSMVGREQSDEYYQTTSQRDVSDSRKTILEVNDLIYDSGDNNVGPISFSLKEGEILGVAGVDGSGKERLGRMLAGDISPTSGTITINGNEVPLGNVKKMVDAGVGYIPKDRKAEGVLLYQPLIRNTAITVIRDMYGSLPFIDTNLEKKTAKESIKNLNIKTPGANTLVQNLSGGNQQKVVIGKWLVREMPILIMDNVTRGIDVGAKEEIYQICRELTQEGKSIIFIGDELPEVIGLSNRVAIMRQGKLANTVETPPDSKPTEEEIIQDMI